MARIVHLTSVHDPFDTRIFFKQCQSLRQAGHEVVLVAAHGVSEEVDGVRIKAVPLPRGRAERLLSTTRRVVGAGLEEHPDLVHLHDPELLPFARKFRRRGIPVVFDMHENVPKALRTKDWIPAALRKPVAAAYRGLERVLLAPTRVVIAEHSYAKDYPWLRTPTTVLNLPLARELTEVRATRFEHPTVGYMGVVSTDRGAMTTLRALSTLASEGFPVDFECIGRIGPELRSQLEAELGDRVHVRGPMKPRDGWEVIARCHIGLALLKPIPNYLESYPTKLFEYMALGLPVVCSDFPLYRDVVVDAGCGICVDPEDHRAVATAIRTLIENPEEAGEMGERGRAAVLARYDWSGEAAKLLDLYAELLPQAAQNRPSKTPT